MKSLFRRSVSLLLMVFLLMPASLAEVSAPASGRELYEAFAAEDLVDTFGNPFDTSAMLRRPSVVIIWATWCGCVVGIPAIDEISAEYAGRVNVIGLQLDAVQDDLIISQAGVSEAQRLFEDIHVYRSVVPSAAIMAHINVRGIEGIPTNVFLDADGRFVRETLGQNTLESWREEIDALLREVTAAGFSAGPSDSNAPLDTTVSLPFSVREGEGLLNDLLMGGMATSDDRYVYFSGPDGSLDRMNLDGTDLRTLWAEGVAQGLTVKDGWVYVSFEDDRGQGHIARIDREGNNRQVIRSFEAASASGLNVQDDGALYFIKYLRDAGEDGFGASRVFRMQTDGSDERQISDAEAWGLYVDGGWIYAHDATGPYQMGKNGGELERIDERIRLGNGFALTINSELYGNAYDDANREIMSFNVADGTVYYTFAEEGTVRWIRDGVKGSYDLGDYDTCYVGNIAGGWVFLSAQKFDGEGDYQYGHQYMLRVAGDQVRCVQYE